MLGIDRRALQAVWTLFLFALVLFIIYTIGRTLIIFALALLLTYLISPIVNFIERRFPPRVPRVASLALVYIAIIAALIAILIPVTSRISQEAAAFANRVPALMNGDPVANLPFPRWLEPFRPQIESFVRNWLADFSRNLGPRLASAGTSVLKEFSSILGAILIPILSFFFLKDGPILRDTVVDLFAPNRREVVDMIFSDIHDLLAQYIRALVFLSLATFAFYSIFLLIVGGPYPFLLAGLAATLEFIPTVGPLAGALAIVIAAAASGFSHILIIVIFLVVYRIFQDYVLNPYLMSAGVELHPLLVLFGVLAGEQLLGIPGMFFSVPAMAALRMTLIRLSRRKAG